jgi:Mannosyltransferase (PIG-V)
MRQRIGKTGIITVAWLRLTATRLVDYLAHSDSAKRPIPWRMLVRTAFPLWLITRLMALVITYLSQTMLRADIAQSPCKGCVLSLDSIINSWRLWDGGFFARILTQGYDSHQPIEAAFWPLYPLLSKPFELLLGPGRWQIALLVTSNLATLAVFVLLGALATQEDEALGAARRAMLILSAAPLALFLIATYSDSLFLAFAVATLLCARRGQWRAAALWAFLAALTRPTGVILVLPLLWEYGRQQPWPTSWRALRIWLLTAVLLVVNVPLAIGLYSASCQLVYHDPLAWLHAEAMFMHQAMLPWDALGYAWGQFTHLTPGSFQQARVLVDDIPLAFVLVCTLVTFRRIPVSYSLYLAGLLLMILTSPIIGVSFPHAFVSAGRYLLAAIPVYLILARMMKRFPWLDALLIGGGFAVQSLLIAFVVTGGWLV